MKVMPWASLVVGAAIAVIFTGSPALTQACNAASVVTYQVEGTASPDSVGRIKDGIAIGDAYFQETLGRTVCSKVVVRVYGGPAPFKGEARTVVASGTATVEFSLGASGSRPAVQRMKTAAHEYFHVLQAEMQGRKGPEAYPASGPAWLLEGSAELMGWQAIDWKGLLPYVRRREAAVRQVKAPSDVPGLASLETPKAFESIPGTALKYPLVMLAVDFLTKDSGLRSLRAYYEALARTAWQPAFQAAFGRSVSDFYKEWEEHRRTL